MADPRVSPLVPIPSPFPNIDFALPYWVNQIKNLVMITCAEPDLLMVEMAGVAAMQAFWTIATPSTKQLIEASTGKSWVCSAKTIVGDAEKGLPIATDGATKFVYGMARGLDVFAYWQFLADILGQGLINWMSMGQKVNRVCNGSLSPNRGRLWVYGSPAGDGGWGAPGTWLNAAGNDVGAVLPVRRGQFWEFSHWGRLQGLNGSPVTYSSRVVDKTNGQVLTQSRIDGFDKPNNQLVSILTSDGLRTGKDSELHYEIRIEAALDNRIVSAGGGCYAHAHDF